MFSSKISAMIIESVNQPIASGRLHPEFFRTGRK